MNRRHRFPGGALGLSLLFGSPLLLGFAASCSSDARPSLISESGGTTPGSAGASNAGAPAVSDAGAPGQGGDGESDGGESGAPSPNAGSAGTAGSGVLPPTCRKAAAWSDSASVADVSSADTEVLLAITPDELDLAFLRGAALYVAHRASASGSFTLGDPLAIPAGWSVADGAALSADGKRLLLSGAQESKLGELTRSSRTGAFTGSVDTTAFALVNQDAIYTGRIYASPALSAGDDQLFFNSAFPDGSSTIVVATRKGNDPWSPPQQLVQDTLDGDPGMRRLPSGVSSDARTLFYFNEASNTEEARWRDTAVLNSPLTYMLNLGERRSATPNSACDRLYSESNGDVVVETD